MNISETVSYDKGGSVVRFPLFRKLFLALVIILVALLAFGLGRLSVVGERDAVKIEYDESITREVSAPSVLGASAETLSPEAGPVSVESVVVSKNGTRYHFLHCSGAKQIKEENKIVFPTPAEAEAAGYTLAANCKPR